MSHVRPDEAERRLSGVVAYIERGLLQKINLSDVASQAGLSEHHFHRLFRARFGLPVMDYIRRRRLSLAAEHLLETSASVLEIALEAGFESQAAFTRAFRKVYFTAPAGYRRRGHAVPWLSVDALSEETLASLPELSEGVPRRAVLDSFWVAGLAMTVSGDERARIADLWRQLNAIRPVDTTGYGLSLPSSDIVSGVLHYMAAIEIDDPTCAPPGLTALKIPAGPYLVFPFRGPRERLAPVIDYLFGAWLPASRFRLRQAPSFERYGTAFGDLCEADLFLPVEDES